MTLSVGGNFSFSHSDGRSVGSVHQLSLLTLVAAGWGGQAVVVKGEEMTIVYGYRLYYSLSQG